MRKALLVIVIASLALAGWCVTKRMFQDDRERIVQIIEEMRLAAQEKSPEKGKGCKA